MLNDDQLRAAVARAMLAPSVHNVQPARWRRDRGGLLLTCDLGVGLAVGDPEGLDAGLSCGAAAEAMVLALSAIGIAATVTDLWANDDRRLVPGHRVAARLVLAQGNEDRLHRQLERRHTHRGGFDPAPVNLFGWGRQDAILVTDAPGKSRLAELNDWASLEIMRQAPFRRELLSWMRLSPRHPRYAHDGLNREAMAMSAGAAFAAQYALGPFWPLLNRLGQTKAITAEAEKTVAAQVIACFHREAAESPVTSGRAYLRMCLEAAGLGLAGWPMAALSDHPATRAEVKARYGLGDDRRLVQVIRFGVPNGPAAARARRPVSEVLT
jgi:hypothetical protein